MPMRTATFENFGSYSHKRIHHEMYGGPGLQSQGDVMAGWHTLAENLEYIRDYVNSAVRGVRATYHGAAGDAAAGAIAPMGAWVDEVQRLVTDTHKRIDGQIDAFIRARGNVPEVPPKPRDGGWKEHPLIDHATTSDQEIDEAFNAEQQRQARAAMMAYQNDTNERVVSVAQFAPPPTGEPNLSIPTARRSEVGGFPASGAAGPGGGGGAVPGAQTSLAGVGAGGSAELPAAPTSPQGGGGFVDPDRGGGGRGAPATPAMPGAVPGGAVPVRPAAGGLGGPGSGWVGAGRGSSGGGAGMRGGSGAGGFRPPGGRPGVGGFGPERGGFGPAGSPESAAARAANSGVSGAGAGRGAANAGGVPFGGAGAGRGDQDNERQRPSYLIEPDSNQLIGELPWTAPAVIGEDLPDDEPGRR